MNYSDYDSDGYSSNEDEDYVPSGKRFQHEVSIVVYEQENTDEAKLLCLCSPYVYCSVLTLYYLINDM